MKKCILKDFISADLTKEVFKKLNEFQASKAVIKKVITVMEKGAVVIPKLLSLKSFYQY